MSFSRDHSLAHVVLDIALLPARLLDVPELLIVVHRLGAVLGRLAPRSGVKLSRGGPSDLERLHHFLDHLLLDVQVPPPPPLGATSNLLREPHILVNLGLVVLGDVGPQVRIPDELLWRNSNCTRVLTIIIGIAVLIISVAAITVGAVATAVLANYTTIPNH